MGTNARLDNLVETQTKYDGEVSARAELCRRLGGTEEQVKLLWDSVLKVESVAKRVTADEVQSLASILTDQIRAHGEELDKLKHITDTDPVWQSFAHVGTLVNKLHQRLDDMGEHPPVEKVHVSGA